MNCKKKTNKFPEGYFFHRLAESHKLKLGKIPLKTQTIMYKSDKRSISALAVSYDKILAVGSVNGEVALWNLRNQRMIKVLKPEGLITNRVLQLFVSQKHKILIRNAGLEINIYKWPHLTLLRSLDSVHRGTVSSLDMAPNETMFASGSQDTTIKLWNISDCEMIHCFPFAHGKSRVNALSFSPCSIFLISGSNYGESVKVWNVVEKTLFKVIENPHENAVFCIKVSSDSKFFLSCSLDEQLKRWNMQSGELERTARAHLGGVSSCVISPNGKFMITGGNDKKMKVWNGKGCVIWQAPDIFIDVNMDLLQMLPDKAAVLYCNKRHIGLLSL